jgi:CheY-like chemotaxis protein
MTPLGQPSLEEEFAFTDRRVLVVEDEALIAMLIGTALQQHGCHLVGPVSTLAAALQAAEQEALDAALLDLNLGGEITLGVAELLERRGVPFVFLTGYGEDALPADRPGWRAIAKPFRMDALLTELSGMLTAG